MMPKLLKDNGFISPIIDTFSRHPSFELCLYLLSISKDDASWILNEPGFRHALEYIFSIGYNIRENIFEVWKIVQRLPHEILIRSSLLPQLLRIEYPQRSQNRKRKLEQYTTILSKVVNFFANNNERGAAFELMVNHGLIPRLVTMFHEIHQFNPHTLTNLKDFATYDGGRYGEMIRLADENLHQLIQNANEESNIFELVGLFWPPKEYF